VPVTAANWSPARRRNLIFPAPGIFYNDFALVLLSSSAMVTVNVVGSLPGCEIVALVMLPFLFLRHGERAFKSEYSWFYFFLGLWLFGTIAGDVYLGSTLARSFKGFARVVFLGLDFTVLVILVNGKTRAVIAFTLGFVPVMLYIAFLFRRDFLVAWKFGLGYAITLLALLVACHFYALQRYGTCIFIFLAVASLNFVFAARSQVAIDLISLILMLPAWKKKSTSRGGTTAAVFRILVPISLACGAALTANQAIKFGAEHNFFDEGIQDKFQTQEAGKLGVLVGGRPETLVAIRAILDSPIVGHGSFAVDQKYNTLQQDIEYENGYASNDIAPDDESAGIPAHSHLTQSWVESGVLGGTFWIFGLVLTSRAIVNLVLRGPQMTPLFVFLLVGFVWDIFYSPMGSFDRLWGAFAFFIAYNVLKASRLQDSLARRPAITSKQTGQRHMGPTRVKQVPRPYQGQREGGVR
jgi:hypothetical protein